MTETNRQSSFRDDRSHVTGEADGRTSAEYYAERCGRVTDDIARLKRRNRWFVMGEILTFSLFILSVVAMTRWGVTLWWSACAFFWMAAYVLTRHCDARNEEAVAVFRSLKRYFERETGYLNGDLSGFDNGERYIDANHPFTFDLDIFGENSLFQRMNRTVTNGGADELARRLSSVIRSRDEIERMAEAVEELKCQREFRASFVAAGIRRPIDTKTILHRLDAVRNMPLAHRFDSPLVLLASWVAIAGLWICVLLASFSVISVRVPIGWGVVQFFVVLMMCSGELRAIGKTAGVLHREFGALMLPVRMVAANDRLSVGVNRDDRQLLTGAVDSMNRFDRLLSALDRRGNVLGLMLLDTFLLSDVFLIRRYHRWLHRHLHETTGWLDAVARLDARISAATFCDNEPRSVKATVTADKHLRYDACGLWHPFIRKNAVPNDFSLTHRHYYIVTGANMAGKSTFLRTLGINYVLAMNGLPVFAESMTVSPFRLFTGMRTSDDLAHGISYFNAELLRLQHLLRFVSDTGCGRMPAGETSAADDANVMDREMPALIILDEILKGTNSLDKLNGSRLFLRSVARTAATGVIATHDLELSKMADDPSNRYHNHCFEIELSSRITYSYRITEGVARNQNATFLLRDMIRRSGVLPSSAQ